MGLIAGTERSDLKFDAMSIHFSARLVPTADDALKRNRGDVVETMEHLER
jgi:hypothetical protein